jgi:hypothetical protein
LAAQAGVAAIYGYGCFLDGVKAIQGLGQRSRDVFEFAEAIAGKKVAVGQATALKGTLKQLDARGLAGEIFE